MLILVQVEASRLKPLRASNGMSLPEFSDPPLLPFITWSSSHCSQLRPVRQSAQMNAQLATRVAPPPTGTSLHLGSRLCPERGNGKGLRLARAQEHCCHRGKPSRSRPFSCWGRGTLMPGTQARPAQAPASFPGLAPAHHCLACGASITPLCLRLPQNKDVSSSVPLLASTPHQED